MERRGAEFELQILNWPKGLSEEDRAEILSFASLARMPIQYNQDALDELSALMQKGKVSDDMACRFAEQVWIRHELKRTPEGLKITREREASEAILDAQTLRQNGVESSSFVH